MDTGNSGGSSGNSGHDRYNNSSSNNWGVNQGNGGISSSIGKSFGNMPSVVNNDPWSAMKAPQPQGKIQLYKYPFIVIHIRLIQCIFIDIMCRQ